MEELRKASELVVVDIAVSPSIDQGNPPALKGSGLAMKD